MFLGTSEIEASPLIVNPIVNAIKKKSFIVADVFEYFMSKTWYQTCKYSLTISEPFPLSFSVQYYSR